MPSFSFSLRFILMTFAATACAISVYLGTETGSLRQTHNEFDIAIIGKGYFQIYGKDISDSTVHYTRRGKLKIDSDGMLCLRDQSKIWTIEPAITIPSDWVKMDILDDGNVMVYHAGKLSAPENVGQLQLSRFMGHDDLIEEAEGLYHISPNGGAPHSSNPLSDGAGPVQQGWLDEPRRIGNHWLATATFLFGMMITTGIEVVGNRGK